MLSQWLMPLPTWASPKGIPLDFSAYIFFLGNSPRPSCWYNTLKLSRDFNLASAFVHLWGICLIDWEIHYPKQIHFSVNLRCPYFLVSLSCRFKSPITSSAQNDPPCISCWFSSLDVLTSMLLGIPTPCSLLVSPVRVSWEHRLCYYPCSQHLTHFLSLLRTLKWSESVSTDWRLDFSFLNKVANVFHSTLSTSFTEAPSSTCLNQTEILTALFSVHLLLTEAGDCFSSCLKCPLALQLFITLLQVLPGLGPASDSSQRTLPKSHRPWVPIEFE